MSVIVLFVDLRNRNSVLKEIEVPWSKELSAADILEKSLSGAVAAQIEEDLTQRNNPFLIVSWNSLTTGEHSDVGGVGSLDWPIDDNLILTVTYEDESTTAQQVDESSEWMLSIYDKYSQ